MNDTSINTLIEKLTELQGSIEGKKEDEDKTYRLFANQDREYKRKKLPSIAKQKELDKIRLKRKNLNGEIKQMICEEMGFDESDISEELPETEYIKQALPLVIKDCPDFDINNVISKTAKEAINDFLLDT